MPTIYDMIDRIRRRPGVYIYEPSLRLLRAFINGYQFAVFDNNVPLEAEEPPFWAFHDWVAKKFHRDNSGKGWCRIICEEAGSDAAAQDLFFQLLDEFRQRTPETIYRIQLPPDFTPPGRGHRWMVVDGREIPGEPPAEIRLVKYRDDETYWLYYIERNGGRMDYHFSTCEQSMARVEETFGFSADAWQREDISGPS